jgi:hypothetical protein
MSRNLLAEADQLAIRSPDATVSRKRPGDEASAVVDEQIDTDRLLFTVSPPHRQGHLANTAPVSQVGFCSRMSNRRRKSTPRLPFLAERFWAAAPWGDSWTARSNIYAAASPESPSAHSDSRCTSRRLGSLLQGRHDRRRHLRLPDPALRQICAGSRSNAGARVSSGITSTTGPSRWCRYVRGSSNSRGAVQSPQDPLPWPEQATREDGARHSSL